MTFLLLLAASLAHASELESLRALAPKAESVPVISAVRELPPPVWELLDPKFLEPAPELETASREEWRRRLQARGGQASFALLSPPDPAREVLLFVPGMGMKFQDAYGLARLDDEYQVVIAVGDETRAVDDLGEELAEAFGRFAREHAPLGRPLRVLGHSMGVPIANFLLPALASSGLLGKGGRFPKALYLSVEGPWRGVDMPFPAAAPGVRGVVSWLLRRLPLGRKRATKATASIFNRGNVMKRQRALEFPPEVTIHHVTVLGRQDTSEHSRHYEPVANWYSEELGAGELKRLWEVLRHDGGGWNQYDTWALTGLARKQGLQNLQRALLKDGDYDALGWELRRAALESDSPEAFAPRWDALIAQIVDTFHGHHTNFMWEDPDFLPYLRGRLAIW